MITNLIVMDDEHISENGQPMEDADIYRTRLVCHPLFKEPLRKYLCEIDPTYKPIFVSKKEWLAMEIMSKLITRELQKEKLIALETTYQEWWNNILKRAEEEHNVYLSGIKKG